ncbi:DUF441 family protein [Clostridium sp. DJ247]|uniref:DUF441 family protein n=1 Tax=Clostridium sp. DJ247 TaxID=2726188 RepID=UPI001626B87A|nr:DUF441 family protein [Clostridium sp. DJ247]MBC2582405.1 DUF441 domain-containing protein [Clostridium sp. DJ247]
MQSSIILVIILAIAIIGHSDSVAIATCILLCIKLLHLDNYVFPLLEKRGLSFGLILLIASILIPIAKGDIDNKELLRVFASWTGVAALLLSLLTTYLSGLGLNYLTVQGHVNIMPALIAGAIIAASFLGGVPVGPFITSGILALMVKLFYK